MREKRKKRLRLALKIVCWSVAAAVAAGMAAFAVAWCMIDWTDEGADEYPGGVVLRDSSGEVLRVSLGEGDVDCRPYYKADPDDWIVKALVASEDGTFWTHCGVRPLSALRAAVQNIAMGRRISGASTITMQTVRLISPHPKTLKWKAKEAVKALKMELRKDKKWIISQYLNRAPYGSNFIGVEAAASGWFGKKAKDLGPGEAALLAGMVQAPSRFRPDRWLERALKRREYVLRRMELLGMLMPEQAKAAAAVRPVVCRAPRPFSAPYFCDWAMQKLGRDRRGQRRSGDFETTLEADAQRIVEKAVNGASRHGGWSVAAVVMRVDTGAVVALSCSGNYFDQANGQVNTACAPRPAGSTLKPFLAALAMDRGLSAPEERLADLPLSLKGYAPANFDGCYRGLVTLRDSLVLSLNIPFVQLLRRVGVPRFGTLLRTLGLSHMKGVDGEFGLGMAIGNVETTLLELVGAYGTIARGGEYRAPCALKDETVGAGCSPGIRIFSPGACHLVSDALSGDERSTASLGHMADVVAPRFAWKTGTSAAYRDAWTVLWNPEYVVGGWCGHKFGSFGDKTLVGAKAAAPVAWKIARLLYPSGRGPWFVEPGDVKTRAVCALTGLPANPDCPKTEEGRFIAGHSSSALCEVHGRDADGRLVVRNDAYLAAFSGIVGRTEKLSISKPENDATFCLVPGLPQQKVVCQVVGNVADGRLWWFVDGVPSGETVGLAPFAWTPSPGTHLVSCTTVDGVSSCVRIHVR
jgi:penicillin-binding protein 1C